MERQLLYRCVVVIDIHQAKLTAYVLPEDCAGAVQAQLRELNGFQRDRHEMAQWVASFEPEQVVMDSTGSCWNVQRNAPR